MKTEELLLWVRGIEATEAIVGLTISAAGKVRVLSFVPLKLDPPFEEIVEKAQDIALAALRCNGAVWRSTVMEKLEWVFDELAFPRTMAAVGKSWRGARFENGEPRTRSVGDSERRGREVDGAVGDGEKVRERAVCVG